MDEPLPRTDMDQNIALVRRNVLKVEGVSDTWIEWESDELGERLKVLVVEVDFPTDPNSWSFNAVAFDAIDDAVRKTPGGTIISRLRVVPRRPRR